MKKGSKEREEKMGWRKTQEKRTLEAFKRMKRGERRRETELKTRKGEREKER